MSLERLLDDYTSGKLSTLSVLSRLQHQDKVPLSMGQMGMWLSGKKHANASVHNIPLCFHSPQTFEESCLQQALDAVVQQFPILLSKVDEVNGQPTLSTINPDSIKVEAHHKSSIDDSELSRYWRKCFDLSQGPLVRVDLFRVPDDGDYLLFSLHHIIFDGSSVEPFVSSFFDYYLSYSSQQPLKPKHHDGSYQDFIWWQRQYLSSDAARTSGQWWSERITDLPEAMTWPCGGADNTESASSISEQIELSTVERGLITVELSPQQTQALSRFCEQHQISRASLWLSLFYIVLNRFTGAEDLIVGVPSFGRTLPAMQRQLGCFINMMPMRQRDFLSLPIERFTKQVQLDLASALEHADYPYLKMLETNTQQQSSSGQSLFDVSFNYLSFMQQADYDQMLLGLKAQLGVELLARIRQDSEYALTLDVEEHNHTCLQFSFDTEVIGASLVHRLSEHYVSLLQVLGRQESRPIVDIETMGTKERRLLVDERNETVGSIAEDTFYQCFMSQVQHSCDKLAVTFEAQHWSYRQLAMRVNDIAAALQEHGVQPGDRVAIFLERSAEMVAGLLAVMKIGATYVPLDPNFPQDRLAYMISDCEASVVLSQTSLGGKRETLERAACGGGTRHWCFVDDILSQSAEGVEVALDFSKASALAYVIYTSGSTGRPKGVMITHRALMNFLSGMQDKLQLTNADAMAAITTISFDIAALELFLPLAHGACCHISSTQTARNPEALKRWVGQCVPTIMQATPVTWDLLFKVGWQPKPSLTLLCGGDTLAEGVKEKMTAGHNKVWNMYGPTETTIWSTMARLSPGSPVTIGKPIKNTQVYVLDSHRRLVPEGVVGELYIGGDGVAVGYDKQPELTAEKFIQSPFISGLRLYKTGDLAYWTPASELCLVGRADNQVKVRGYRIELGDIEHGLNRIEVIHAATVILHQKRLIAFYLTRTDHRENVSSSVLRQQASLGLPEYMVPDRFVHLEAFPLTPNGKIDRKQLMAMMDEESSDNGVSKTVTPANDNLIVSLKQLFREVLDHDVDDVEEGFFNLGGNSVLAVQLVERINAEFGISCSITDLFDNSSIATLSKHLSGLLAKEKASLGVDGRQDIAPDLPAPVDENDIAIIGMSCQFPDANDHRVFWQNLVAGKDSISPHSEHQLQAWGIDEERLSQKGFTPQAATISGKGDFDHEFFSLSPKDAELIDPQARLLLLNAWKAIEDAGYTPSAVADSGVFLSASNYFYQAQIAGMVENTNHQRILDDADQYIAWLLAQGGSIPTMVSHKLGFTGPSLFVNTNCSSSLVAIHLACQSLNSGESTTALVGAASVFAAESVGYVHKPGLNFSGTGRCRAFDADADGMIGGEGAATVLLKKASRAVADGDHIYGVIRASSVNNDGADKAGFYAPGVKGQVAVIDTALKKANVSPEEISFVEAHGTGTKLGDPIEVAALTRSWQNITTKNQFCGIGSVKTNIGHLDAAAGLAGLIKAVLSLHHSVVPKSLHFDAANPAIDFAASPFYVLRDNKPLPARALPHHAAVSSFGIGGTNAHVILAQAPVAASQQQTDDRWVLIPLAAKKAGQLKATATDLLRFLQTPQGEGCNLLSLAYTLQTGRTQWPNRIAFVVNSISALKSELASFVAEHDVEMPVVESTTSPLVPDGDLHAAEQPMLEQLKSLWLSGQNIDWEAGYVNKHPFRMSLPGYAFLAKSVSLHCGQAPIKRARQDWIKQWPELVAQWQVTSQSAAAEDSAQLLSLSSSALVAMDSILMDWLLALAIELKWFDPQLLRWQSPQGAGSSSTILRWLEHTERILLKQYSHNFSYFSSSSSHSLQEVQQCWQQWKKRWAARADLMAKAALVEATMMAIPEIYSGQRKATEVLFPGARLDLVEGIYQRNPIADHFNGQLAAAVADWIAAKQTQPNSRPVRILEVGAGTGSTTRKVLAALASKQCHVAEYCFTDVSNAFLHRATQAFATEYPFVSYQLFNANQTAEEQNFSFEQFDIVIATNVLHATESIDRTLRNIRPLLNDDGRVFINEITDNSLYMHLTFGLLDDWWVFNDEPYRCEGGPALNAASWQQRLKACGFSHVDFLADSLEDAGLQLIAAVVDPQWKVPISVSGDMQQTIQSVGAEQKQPRNMLMRDNENECETKAVTKRVVKQALVTVLRMQENDVSDELAFADYGLDSLSGVAMVEQLNQQLGIELSVTALFDFPSISRLTTHISSEFSPKVAPCEGSTGDVVASDAADVNPVEDDTSQETDDSAVAIIGFSGRFPGADNPEDLWQKLLNGEDLTEPVSRWQWDEQQHSCPRGGFIDGIDQFDPLFFNISGLEARYMEPQQRLFLMESWKALEHAGYAGESIHGQKCGVFVGCTTGDYFDLNSSDYPAQAFWGNMSSVIPSRIAYYLNLKGPSLAVDTACSSSLVAVHLACQSLRQGESEVALAGGIFLQCSSRLYTAGTRAGMLSPSGYCHAFDHRADGFVPAEAVGVLVLKPLKKAIADGDCIHGVIRGTAINQDGATNGITAPSGLSQQTLCQQVYSDFNLNPEQLQYLETHGTGTSLGDPIEFQALDKAFTASTKKQGFCALGSVKANMGHTQMAAGVVGIIKVLLAMKHQQLPPMVNYQTPNPKIALENSPFYINTVAMPWLVSDGERRRAAISSFGASGTNGHIVIEEAGTNRLDNSGKASLFMVSARTSEQLRDLVSRLCNDCQQQPTMLSADLAYTLAVGRQTLKVRMAWLADDLIGCLQAMTDWLNGVSNPLVYCSDRSVVEQQSLDERRREHELAQWFVAGETIDIADYFAAGGYQRVPLAVSSFALESYWLPSLPLAQQSPQLHPLLHRQCADDEFISHFTGEEPFFAEHRVNGVGTLPGSGYLEMAVAGWQASSRSKHQGVVISDVVWMSLLQVGAGESTSVALALSPSDTSGVKQFSVSLAGQESSQFCSGYIGVADPSPSPRRDMPMSIAAMALRDTGLSPEQIYTDYRQSGVDYGPSFQGIKKVYAGNERVIAQLKIPEPTMTESLFSIHPAMLDSAIQCVKFLSDDAEDSSNYLLFAAKEIIVYGNTPSMMWAEVRSRQGNSGSSNKTVDIDLFDENGNCIVAMRKFVIRRIVKTETSAPLSSQPSVPSHQASLFIPITSPLPVRSRTCWPLQSERVAVVGDLDSMTMQLVTRFGEESLLAETKSELPQALSAWIDRRGGLDHLFWVLPVTPVGQTLNELLLQQKQMSNQFYRLLKVLLAYSLDEHALGLTIVTRDGDSLSSDSQTSPSHAAIHGMVGTLAKEYPNWSIRLADFAASSDSNIEELLSLSVNTDGNPAYYRSGLWYQQQLCGLALTEEATVIKEKGVYLIVGGAGGLGCAITEYLMQRYQAQVIWVGRTPMNPHIEAKVAAMEGYGAAPSYYSCDAADSAEFEQTIAKAEQRFGAINGVVHAALDMQPDSLDRLTEAAFQAGLRSKVETSLNIAQTFSSREVDFYLYVSSINSYLKAMGQSSYSAGCAFIDALAKLTNVSHPGRSKVINLGYCFNNLSNDAPPAISSRPKHEFISKEELMWGIESLLACGLTQLTLMKPDSEFNLRGIEFSEELRTLLPAENAVDCLYSSDQQWKTKWNLDEIRRSTKQLSELIV
ncbi:L-histidine N(alpha)-methyltransferase [Motilimonas cestriensis]|uniref:L-histidine N(alpha)-methyltransferase n=1 Tax=Motilimonas cestriensis TaxID=2742685 RepID=UPI003DA6A1EB